MSLRCKSTVEAQISLSINSLIRTFTTQLITLTLCMLGNFACFFVVCDFFLKSNISIKNLSEIPSECQTVWIQIRPDVLFGLIWVQTLCKGYQQMTKVATSRERVNKSMICMSVWEIQ